MRKNAAWLLMICFLVASIATVPLPAKAQFKTITVPDDYSSIQDAVYAANPGDTVYVRAGYYNGTVEINKPLQLIGDYNKAVINTWYVNGQAAILITASNVVVSGLTIDNPSPVAPYNLKRGIHLLGASNCTISNNIVSECTGEGIWLYQSSNNQIINNTVTKATTGLSIGLSSNNRAINNTVKSTIEGINVYYNAFDNVFCDNEIRDSSLAVLIGDNAFGYNEVNNTFYHNNFIDNDRILSSYSNISAGIRFDNGYEGNFYSDYVGQDFNGDGLGDSSYVMVTYGADIFDPYPLFAPWNANNLIPVIHILSPAGEATLNTPDVVLSFNLSRASQELKYSLDGSANTTVTGNVTIPNLSSGNHTLTLYAIGLTGAEALPQTVNFTVDLPLIPNTVLVWVAITVFLAVAISIVAILVVSRRMNRRN